MLTQYTSGDGGQRGICNSFFLVTRVTRLMHGPLRLSTTLAQHKIDIDHVYKNVKDTIFVRYCLIGQIQNQVKFMNTSTEHIYSAINQSH